MKKSLSIAAVVTALIAAPVAATELTPKASEKVLANGEVIWNNERGAVAVRIKSNVFLCTIGQSFNPENKNRFAELTCYDSER